MKPQKTDKASFSALILSSGLSERMGTPKALLKWDDTSTFIEKIIREYLSICNEVVCTVNSQIYPQCLELKMPRSVKLVLNEHPEWGRLYSVRLGLAKVRYYDYCFIQNVDNPFICSETLSLIASQSGPEAWCSPEFDGKGGHPVLIPQLITRKILEATDQGLTLQDMLRLFPKKVVEMGDDAVLRNINTAEAYLEFRNNRF